MKKRQLEKLAAQVRRCKKCRLWRTRTKAVPGEGPSNAKLMLVGMAPGREEDLTGKPFVGRAGKILDELLEKNNIDRKKCFITSTVKCFPPRNRRPKPDELAACKPYLLKQIGLIKPKVIVLLGDIAVQALLGKVQLSKIRGKKYALDSAIYLVTYHPAAARFPKIKAAMQTDFAKLRKITERLC